MYNDYEEKEFSNKFNFKIWKRIFKEMWKYPHYCIGAVIAMIGCAFAEAMFIKFICADGLQYLRLFRRHQSGGYFCTALF